MPRDDEHARLRDRVVGLDVVEQCSDTLICKHPDWTDAVLALRGMIERAAR